MSIAEQTNALKFNSFNDFFTRGLRTGVRAVDADSTAIVSPADGAISQLGKIENGDVFQAKGQKFTVENLIADPQLAEPFKMVNSQQCICHHVTITVYICHLPEH